MGMNGDWKTLSKGADIEIRIEPVQNSEGTIVSYNKDYRTVSTRVVMETFSGVASLPAPVVQPPVTGEEKIISDVYALTQKESDSGEHTITYQMFSAWASF